MALSGFPYAAASSPSPPRKTFFADEKSHAHSLRIGPTPMPPMALRRSSMSAIFRSALQFSGAWPVRARHWSSRNTTSSTVLDGFEHFLQANPTENKVIDAIRESREMRFDYAALTSVRDDALRVNKDFSCAKVWSAYGLVRQNDVVKLSSPAEREAITNWLGLSRFGLNVAPKLYSYLSSSQYFSAPRRFELWKGQKQHAPITLAQSDILKDALDMIIVNGAIDCATLREQGDVQLLAEGVRAFGNVAHFDAELTSLSSFILR